MDFTEENLPWIEPEATAENGRRPQHAKRGPHERAFFLHLFENTIVNQVEKLRYDAKDRNVSFLKRSEQLGRVKRREINSACACDQRQQQIRHLRQNVKQRQHAKNGVAWPDVGPGKNRVSFSEKVSVREHHAFGIGSRTGGVEQGSNVVELTRDWFEAVCWLSEDGVEIGNWLRKDSRPRLSWRSLWRHGRRRF